MMTTAEDTMRDNLRAIAWAYARENQLSLTTVSKQVHGSGEFFEKYFQGMVSTRVDTYFTMVNRFRARWPKGLPWPATQPVGKLGRKLDKGFVDAQ
jgi:hypothetical protein